jgi:iron complex outermembrane receptor protein
MTNTKRCPQRAAILGAFALSGFPTELPAEPIERIEVTGSNIRRTNAETGLPLQIITREELERASVHSAQDILDRISAHQSVGGWNENMGVGTTVGGTTGVSMRGLGGDRTLVLLNGVRNAQYALSGGSGVDLSSIPISAIERIEVLKDGASAVYGSDAIAGVVNFVLRRDFRGAEVNVSGLATEHAGGSSWRVNAIGGVGDLHLDRYNWFILGDHSRQDSVAAFDRESTRTGYLPALGLVSLSAGTAPANFGYFAGGSLHFANPSVPPSGPTAESCAPPFSIGVPETGVLCKFDGGAASDSIPKSQRTNVLSRLAVSLSESMSAFAEVSAYRGTFTYRLAPTPIQPDYAHAPMFLPPSSPFYPAAYIASIGGNPSQPIGLNYRLVELGQRVNEVQSELYGGVVGLQGILRDWEYLLSLNHSANRQENRLVSGYADDRLLRPLLESGQVNPFASNTPEALARLRQTQVTGVISDNHASLSGVNARLSGNAGELAGGALAIAVGAEGRRERIEMNNLLSGTPVDLLGGGIPDAVGPVDRHVFAAFAEFNLPMTTSLEANLALRTDHYTDFGTTTNPKVTLRWQASKDAVLRASYGTGFRAPQLYILHAPIVFGRTGAIQDPLRCPATHDPLDCELGFNVRSSGNPALLPEKSRQWNVGMVFEPAPTLSVAIDYYHVEVRDTLSIIPADTIVAFAGSYPTNIIRKPAGEDRPDLPGRIDYIASNFENLGLLRTSGIDLDLRARTPMSEWGRLQVSITGTYVIDYHGDQIRREAPGAGSRAFAFGAISRWRHYASADWSRGAWGVTLAQTFQEGYNEPDLRCRVCGETRRVGSYSILDLVGRYAAASNFAIALGVRNLLDRAPPVSTQEGAFQPGIDPTYADPRGRMIHAAVKYSFR